jgi:hypothetical protein
MVTTKNAAEKSAPKANQTNGTDAKLSNLKVAAAQTPVIVPAESKKPEPKEKSSMSVDDRLLKLDILNSLADKRKMVLAALSDVEGFTISPTIGNCHIRFQDSDSKTFSISHPFVIEEVVKLVVKKLEAELDNIETEIEFRF